MPDHHGGGIPRYAGWGRAPGRFWRLLAGLAPPPPIGTLLSKRPMESGGCHMMSFRLCVWANVREMSEKEATHNRQKYLE